MQRIKQNDALTNNANSYIRIHSRWRAIAYRRHTYQRRTLIMQPTILFKNAHYTACALKNGSLIVSSNRRQYGKQLTGENATQWIDAIKTAVDPSEAHALCKAIINF